MGEGEERGNKGSERKKEEREEAQFKHEAGTGRQSTR